MPDGGDRDDLDGAYGARLYEALKRVGQGTAVTSRMRYADVQRLKAADRAETARLFRGSSYALIQSIKRDAPAEVAALLVGEAEAQARAAIIVIFCGLSFT